jgi:hypothetical protein
MKLYINIKKMIFEEDNIEHEIVLNISDNEFYGYDYLIDLPDDDNFIKKTYKVEYKKDKEGKNTSEIDSEGFIVREIETWNSFPLYEIVDGNIIDFNYTQYQYFADTERRIALGIKVSQVYNVFSELKILRKTLKYIMDELNLNYPDFFDIMNTKIEDIINRNQKDIIK